MGANQGILFFFFLSKQVILLNFVIWTNISVIAPQIGDNGHIPATWEGEGWGCNYPTKQQINSKENKLN